MGYTTDFSGSIEVNPPLNDAETEYLRKFSETRRMHQEGGPYYVDNPGSFGQSSDGAIDYNSPPPGQPGLWCQWVPAESWRGENTALEWDGNEKFYHAEQWMKYLIDHFLKPGGYAQGHPGFEEFTFDHTLNGVIEAQGEDPEDRWRLLVEDNKVMIQQAEVKFLEPKEVTA